MSGEHRVAMNNTYFYTGIVGLTSGIFLRSFFESGMLEVFFLLILGLAFFTAGFLRRQNKDPILYVSCVLCISIGIGIFCLDIHERKVSPLGERRGETGVLEGIVVREPDIRESSQHLYIRESETGALFLVTTNPYEEIAYGDRVRVQGTLKMPESFETDTGRTFDYVGYLKAKGVHEMISFGRVSVIESGQGSSIMRTLLTLKRTFMDTLEMSIPEPAVGLGEGLLLGVKRAIGKDLEEMFRTVGIIHIVVLSGYNIMIVADFVMRFLGLFFFPRTRLIFGIVTIVLFALLVGLSATVVRASIMSLFVLIARTMGRPQAVFRALSITGVLMLIHNPYLLAFDPGFQLSFLATLGLILLSPYLEKRFSIVPERFGIRGYLATTVSTQLFVLPLLLFSMGTLSLVSVLVNMLVLPAVPVAMLATFTVGLIGLVSTSLGIVFGFGAHLVLSYIIKVAELFSLLPHAALTIPSFPFWLVILMYIAIGYLTYRLGRETREAKEIKIENDYAGWVIEEETERPLEVRSTSSGQKTPLPFR